MLASWASSQSQNGVSLSSFSASWPRRYRASCGSTSDKSCKLIASVVGAPKNHSLFFWFWCPPFFGSNQHPVNIFFTKNKGEKNVAWRLQQMPSFRGCFLHPKNDPSKKSTPTPKKGLVCLWFFAAPRNDSKKMWKNQPRKTTEKVQPEKRSTQWVGASFKNPSWFLVNQPFIFRECESCLYQKRNKTRSDRFPGKMCQSNVWKQGRKVKKSWLSPAKVRNLKNPPVLFFEWLLILWKLAHELNLPFGWWENPENLENGGSLVNQPLKKRLPGNLGRFFDLPPKHPNKKNLTHSFCKLPPSHQEFQ